MPAPPRAYEARLAGCSTEFRRLLQLLAAEHVKELGALRKELRHAAQASEGEVKEKGEKGEKPEKGEKGGFLARQVSFPEDKDSGQELTREVQQRMTSKGSRQPSVSEVGGRDRLDSSADTWRIASPAEHSGVSGSQCQFNWLQVGSMDNIASFSLSHSFEPEEEIGPDLCSRLGAFLQSQMFESIISVLLLANVFFMAFEMQFLGAITGYHLQKYDNVFPEESSWPTMYQALFIADVAFTVLFGLDVGIRIIVLRCRFWRTVQNWIDTAVVVTSAIQWFFPSLSINPVYLRLLRLGKLMRALRMVTMSKSMDSLQLLLKCCASSVDMLFWSFCLLTFIQCVAGMIVSSLVRDFLLDESKPLEDRRRVWDYYGTFTRTFLTMFEILFANWGPPCRALTDQVDEAFSIFFLIYRCMIGFAVLNVVNAVFVQQTMLLANNDEDLAFKQKEKDWEWYSKKSPPPFQRHRHVW